MKKAIFMLIVIISILGIATPIVILGGSYFELKSREEVYVTNVNMDDYESAKKIPDYDIFMHNILAARVEFGKPSYEKFVYNGYSVYTIWFTNDDDDDDDSITYVGEDGMPDNDERSSVRIITSYDYQIDQLLGDE